MVEGGSSDDFTLIQVALLHRPPVLRSIDGKAHDCAHRVLRHADPGGGRRDQIFDSWGGVISGRDYEAASLRWIRRIVGALPPGFPVILFAKGAGAQLPAQAATGVRVLSVDWTVDIAAAHAELSRKAPIALQGNLDPVLLNTSPDTVRREAESLLGSMRGAAGHIVNLGHGILPGAKIECVEALAQTVAEWK